MANDPGIGGGRYTADRAVLADLLGTHQRRRQRAIVRIQEYRSQETYVNTLIDGLRELTPRQRQVAGEVIAVLGDLRLSEPYYLPEMIAVPAGAVTMGSAEIAEEHPVTKVQVGAFSLAQTPVTQAAYSVFVRQTGHPRPPHWSGGEPPAHTRSFPVTWVSAADAEAYCHWLSDQTSEHYRLPTEAEWEYAARGPENQRRYPWGDQFEERRVNAWTRRSARALCAVGLFPEGRGPFRHDDLAGNVWEWTSSVYWPYPYDPTDGREAGQSGERRALRGGSFRSSPLTVRCAARMGEIPTDRFTFAGFRLARR
ncbi:MAG: formylglycine-generating enzyme family protein [Anaerolineae bacterium]